MTDAFEEVDQSLRQEAALTWWKRLYPVIIAAFVAMVVFVGVWEFYKAQKASGIDADAKVYDTATTALRKPDLPAARQAFVQLGQGNGGFAAISNMMAAQVEGQAGKDPAAIELALKAAADKDKGLMGSIALLKLAYLKADTARLEEIEALVKPVIDRGGQTAALARELVAAKALDAGNVERARSEYQALSLEIEAPDAMKQRANQALNALPKASAPAAATTPAAPAPPVAATPATPAPAQPAKPPSQ
ncbi:MAG TPA: tetratricopeptide repeat protein [Hyphomonadaceae bacterium]|nr:tetratricopeptide repeat protein [Hyphomonadaceae bacterium]